MLMQLLQKIIIKLRNFINTNLRTLPTAVMADSHNFAQTLAIIPNDNIFRGIIVWSQPEPNNKLTISEVFAITNDDIEGL